MAYNKWYITGDCHRDFSRFKRLNDEENIAVIILGDAGVNWTLNNEDEKFKDSLKEKYPNITFYLVRGNHEARPTALPNILEDYDEEVDGYVYYEPEYLHIRYFMDGGEYTIDGHKTLVIGGAYSVDKWYRLEMGYRWFADEQLSKEEMEYIEYIFKGGKHYDLVLTHTCPFDFQPTDLFIPSLDQSTVDKTMEIWLQNKVCNQISWDIWLFGHFHASRLERPHVEQYYEIIEELPTIWNRWHGKNEIIDWWLQKSPDYYMI
jgi:3-oxoacid CoA-transferase subunit A